LSPQSAQAATVQTSHTAAQKNGHTVTVPAAFRRAPSAAQLLAASRTAVKQAKQQASTPRSYTVRSGDTLSGIAGKMYHNPAAWPAIYDSNRGKVRWANEITVGEKLNIPAKPSRIPAAPKQLSPNYVPRHAAPTTDVQAAPVQQAPTQTDAYYSGSDGSFQACVIARESGGDPNIWNASGHYGLYQFSEATWIAYGGSASEFGNASVAEQNAVFANAMARGGEDNWAPYDGC
jgi:LysM repeat protein